MKKYIPYAVIALILIAAVLPDPAAPGLAFVRNGRGLLLLRGFVCTLWIILASVLPGALFAVCVAMMRSSRSMALHFAGTVWVRFFEGLPTPAMLLLMFYLFFPGSALTAAVAGFALHFGAVAGEILRRALGAVSKEEQQAAAALGFSRYQIRRYVVLPQALPAMIPELGNAIGDLVQETAVVGYITVVDLTRAADIIRGSSCVAFWPLAVLLLLYWAIARLIAAGSHYAGKKLDPVLRREAARKKEIYHA